ncbi:MAG TPA: hypothetical protein VH120_19870 [Gemmataceae bacterium]|nr:hypothetical protein [Gemmataceae bacterium]
MSGKGKVVTVSPRIFAVFGHFQNLNLLTLIEDLRSGQTARQAWQSGSLLCPVAHGLPRGAVVRNLQALGQSSDMDGGCDYAARHLGAEPAVVLDFVRNWDEEAISDASLVHQLEELWAERLADAEAVQEVIGDSPRPAREDFLEIAEDGHP